MRDLVVEESKLNWDNLNSLEDAKELVDTFILMKWEHYKHLKRQLDENEFNEFIQYKAQSFCKHLDEKVACEIYIENLLVILTQNLNSEHVSILFEEIFKSSQPLKTIKQFVEVALTSDIVNKEHDQDILGKMEEGNINQQNADDDDDHSATLHIPGKHRTSAECRICLSNIVVGETIICSPNPDCIHIYHDTCILSWLSESKAKSDCPCCRLPFIPEAYNNNNEENVSPGSSSQGSSPDIDEGVGAGNDEEERA